MAEHIMQLVNEKFKAMKTRKVWDAPSDDQTESMALSSKLNKLENTTRKLSNSAKAKAKKSGSQTTNPRMGNPRG
jgi:hypothetical protein